jgi:formylmethanofuran dehydrogenase subunit E
MDRHYTCSVCKKKLYGEPHNFTGSAYFCSKACEDKFWYKLDRKKGKTSLAKIDSRLYRQAVEIAKANRVEFPSAKNFIEKAIWSYIHSINYNIENESAIIDTPVLTDRTKYKLEPTKKFTNCMVCSKIFLNDKKKTEQGKQVCPKCAEVIKELNKKI